VRVRECKILALTEHHPLSHSLTLSLSLTTIVFFFARKKENTFKDGDDDDDDDDID